MKFLIAIAVTLMLFVGTVKGDVIKTVGTDGNYATLKAAFDAINAGTVKTGVITLQIISGTTEMASAVLFASGTGSSNYTAVIIYPTVASVISTTGNWSAIDLNGADNVTIDGRLNGTGTPNSLTITGTSTQAAASAIRIVNSAENNTVKYCNLTASSASSAIGIVNIGGSSAGNGNDNNVVEYCNITSSDGIRPYNAILSAGTTGRENSGNIIRNNNIYNTFQTGVSSNAININSASVGFTISGNSIYETTAFVTTASSFLSYNAIRVSTTSEHTITGNYIGGSLPQCGGTAWSFLARHITYFCGIYAYAGATATTISNNTIAKIDFSSKEDNPWDGIFLYAGNFEVSGNTIGASTGTGSIVCRTPSPVATATMSGGVVTGITLVYGGSDYSETAPVITFSNSGSTTPAIATATVSGGVVTGLTLISGGAGYTSTPSVIFDGQSNNYSTSHGMIQNSTGTSVNITGNNIGSITTVGSNHYSHGFESIYVRTILATTTITNNLIGSLTTGNSIHVSSAAASSLIKQDVYGIYSSSTGTTTISGNTVANLFNAYAGTNGQSRTRGIQTTAGINIITNNTVFEVKSASLQTGTGSAASVIGISQTNSTIYKTQTVTGNTVYNLSNTSGTLAVHVYGIYYAGPSTGVNSVSGNFVHSLSAASNNIGAAINGIVINSGLVTCANNIVNLGSTSLGYLINGIWDGTSAGNNVSFYFNTVYIGGSVSSGETSNTAGLWNANNTSTRDYRNNIFYNARTGGTTGIHYALRVAGTTGLTIGYNDYVGPLSGITLNGAPDNNSVAVNPGFAFAGGTSAINYFPSATLTGVSGTGITTDYYSITRTIPKMGALEQNGNVWQGATSTDFATASNWASGALPTSGADIIFATSPVNDCFLDGDRIVGNITNGSSKNLVVNGKTLTVNGSLSFTSSGKINTSTASSVVKFAGSAAQTIPAVAFVSNTVSGLEIVNSSGVALNGDLTVSAGLALTSGTLTVGANTLTITGSSISRTSGNIDASNSSAAIVFENTSAIGLPASVFTGDIKQLTLNTSFGITAASDLSVTGNLNLNAANPSATKGLVDMVSFVLEMKNAATTSGTGDVTGRIVRNGITPETTYTFGNTNTTLRFYNSTSENMPTAIKVIVQIGNTHSTKTNAVKRFYQIVRTGGNALTRFSLQLHYLESELNGITESNLVYWDHHVTYNGTSPHEHGKTELNTSENWISLSGHGIQYLVLHEYTGEMAYDPLHPELVGYSKIWMISGKESTSNYIWLGAAGNSWDVLSNWSGGSVPTSTSDVIIPANTPSPAKLPDDGTRQLKSITIQSGGQMLGGTNSTLEVFGALQVNNGTVSWANAGSFDAGTSTVIFKRTLASIAGSTVFNNMTIPHDTCSLILMNGSTTYVTGTFSKTVSAVFDAIYDGPTTFGYSGGNQEVFLPANNEYYHLELSGSGTKSLPSAAMDIQGDFIITGSTTAVAGGAVTTDGTMSVGPLAKYSAGTYPHTNNGHFIIYSDETGTGSLLAATAFSGTVERYIPNELKWHFLSSPVSAQAIWPEFAPEPAYDTTRYVFNQTPYNWDFYYWNPNANTTNELYWVNLRKNSDGDYNNWSVDAAGSNAGFGASVPPAMTVGRGYLTAYGADWNIPSGSPVTHNFTGTLNYGNKSLSLTKGVNSFNLVGNPYPSAIDWKAESGWDWTNLSASTSGGYDYWIYNDASGNYGVFNSAGSSATHETTRYIAPMQAFFVKAKNTGLVSLDYRVQLHDSQKWLKAGSDPLNVLRFKLTTKANPYYDEMNLEVDPGLANDGSQKFWSMHAEAPEIYAIRDGGYYSIERRSAVDDQTVIPVGIKAGISTSYTLQVTGTESFFYAKNIMLEDLKTGAVQDLKTNPSYTFTATPGDAPERFHLRFSGPYGVDEMEKTSPVQIYTYGNDLVVKSNTPEPVTGDVYLCNLPGQQVFTQRIDGAVTRMTLNLPAGCYIATLVTKDRIFSQKVIVN